MIGFIIFAALLSIPTIIDVHHAGIADKIEGSGGIKLSGAVNGFGPVALASTDIESVLDGTDVVVVVLPALYHRSIAEKCAPFLKPGQDIILHHSDGFGAIEFDQILKENGCKANNTIAEICMLIYQCRAEQPGQAHIFGNKLKVKMAAMPACEGERIGHYLNEVFEGFTRFEVGSNVMETTLENMNALLHPGPTLLNTGRIEGNGEWFYYEDGFTPSVGKLLEHMDSERLAIAKELGLELPSLRQWFADNYDSHGSSLDEAIRNNRGYRGIKGQKTLQTRYLLEDLTFSLTPWISLGEKFGVSTRHIEAVVELGRLVMAEYIDEPTRTLEKLGLAHLTKKQLLDYVETGKTAS